MASLADEVKSNINLIEYFRAHFPKHYRETGNSFSPFRDETEGSFKLYHDHGIDYGDGRRYVTVIDLYMLAHGCDATTAINALAMKSGILKAKKRIVATYDYFDTEGNFLYQHVRYEPKHFLYRKVDLNEPGGWKWSLGDILRVPFGLRELLASPPTETVFDCEGEKDALAMRELGLVAVSCGSTSEWSNILKKHASAKYFEGRDVVIIADADDKGREAATGKAGLLSGIAKRVRVLEFPDEDTKDAADYIQKYKTAARDRIISLAHNIQDYKPQPEDKQEKPKRGRPKAKDKNSEKYLFELVMEFKRGLGNVEDDAIPGMIADYLKSANAKLANCLDESELADLIERAIIAKPKAKKSQVEMGVELLLDEYQLRGWRTVEDDTWATVWMDNHFCFFHVKDRSKKFKAFVRNAYRKKFGATLKNQSCNELIDEIRSICEMSDDVHKLHVRFYHEKGKVIIDCCDDGWNQIEISSEGWQVKPQTKPLFKRVAETLPLPTPVYESGAIEEFLDVLTVTNKKHRLFIKCFLIVACIGDIPRPIYLFNGAPGSAKSSLATAIRDCIDPNILDRLMPNWDDARTLAIALDHCAVVTLENQGSLQTKEINFLCGVATGVTTARYTLYEDDNLTVFKIKKPVIMTAIAPSSIQPDFLDRTVIINRDRIPPDKSKTEEYVKARLDELKPKVLGWICNTLAETIRIKESGLTLTNPPRMHDFALWGEAAARAMGYSDNEFLDIYKENIRNVSQSLALDTPLVSIINEFLDEQTSKTWSGLATPLLKELRRIQAEKKYDKGDLPKAANGLSRILKNLSAALLSQNIRVSFDETKAEGTIWTIERIPEDVSSEEADTDNDEQSEAEDMHQGGESEKVVPFTKTKKAFVCPDANCRNHHYGEKKCLVNETFFEEMTACPQRKSSTQTQKGA